MAETLRPTAAQDAATQARTGEARVLGVDQDQTATGAPDAARGQATLRGNVASTPGDGPAFTRDA